MGVCDVTVPTILNACRATALALALALLVPGLASAQGYGTGAPANSDEWHAQLGGYLFATGITGDVGVRGVSVESDVSFNDIWDNLDAGAMGFGELSHRNYAFVVDGAYLRLDPSVSRVTSGGFVQATLNVEYEQAILAGYATYTLFEETLNVNSSERVFNLDVLGGARYNWIETDLGLDITALGRAATISKSRSLDWVDPVVGLRATYVPLRNWFVSGWFDFGGFGVGADQAWQAIGTAGYRFDNGLDLFAAYRAYHFHYEEGEGPTYINLDLTYAGPEFGLAYRF